MYVQWGGGCLAPPPPRTPGPCPSWTTPSSSSRCPPPPPGRTSGTPDRIWIRWRSRCVCRVKIFALVYKNICRWRWWSAAGPPRRCWVCATTPSSARVWRICGHKSERGKSFMKLSLLTPLLWTVRERKRNFKYWSINRLAVASINKYWLPVCPNNT